MLFGMDTRTMSAIPTFAALLAIPFGIYAVCFAIWRDLGAYAPIVLTCSIALAIIAFVSLKTRIGPYGLLAFLPVATGIVLVSGYGQASDGLKSIDVAPFLYRTLGTASGEFAEEMSHRIDWTFRVAPNCVALFEKDGVSGKVEEDCRRWFADRLDAASLLALMQAKDAPMKERQKAVETALGIPVFNGVEPVAFASFDAWWTSAEARRLCDAAVARPHGIRSAVVYCGSVRPDVLVEVCAPLRSKAAEFTMVREACSPFVERSELMRIASQHVSYCIGAICDERQKPDGVSREVDLLAADPV